MTTPKSFTAMIDSTAEQWQVIGKEHEVYQRALPERVLDHLLLLEGGGEGGFSVSRLEHSLQTATRAFRGGENEEYVVCALLHDIGDTLGPAAHADVAAVILKPYVSEDLHWMVEHHAIFQSYYFFHHFNMSRDLREKFRGHPNFEQTSKFCHVYDQNSFDPNYDTMPLQAFEPMLERVLEKPKNTLYLMDVA